MARRTYEQFCGLAHALDVVGERWTLLIVRELMSGPKRYSDLTAALDGIGTSLLATRVRQLETDGIARRRLGDPPAASVVYELTPTGRELARAVIPLALWGARHYMSDERAPQESHRPEWALVFLADGLDPSTLAGMTADYDFHIDGSTARLRIAAGQATVTNPSAAPADAELTSDAATVAAIAGGRTTIAAAVTNGQLRVEGNPEALQTLLSLLDTQLNSYRNQISGPGHQPAPTEG
ncbi:winged helix-turn-helix transcriptional regulator [Nocardia miyunensis]|uniref:winged helix-turn-helix transcriptional regulator n=1 Tax=Nocardia miyunensis TaxID=282684 RepID=UPI000832C4DD|nr:winged helix-turn-helix transcriptional regulator [Nocardia miyunensis]